MNINEITVYGNGAVQKNAEKKSPFLNIGKKGQLVEGTITKVGNGVTLNFQGIEVSVSKEAVKSPVEGQTRKFEIMAVSAERIVLKEAAGVSDAGEVRSMVSTTADTSGYTFSECLANSSETKEAKETANQTLSILTGEDYEAIEEEEGDLEQKTKECIERAAERKKERTDWTKKQLEEGKEYREEVQEEREKREAEGFLAQKSEEQIRAALEEAGLPATEEAISQIVTALKMSRSVTAMTDRTKAYLIGQQLPPTIENIYQGAYCGQGKAVTAQSEEEFKQYEEQVRGILERCGMDTTEGLQEAKWLFANELPIDEESLGRLKSLEKMSADMDTDKVLEQIVYAMRSGELPKDASMDTSEIVLAKQQLMQFAEISDTAITVSSKILLSQKGSVQEAAADMNLRLLWQTQSEGNRAAAVQPEGETPKVLAESGSQEELLAVTTRRQLEEIRQKMTLQAAVSMAKRGIHLETESLESIVKQLRELENTYYCKQTGQAAETVEPEKLALFQEVLQKTDEVAKGHAGVLGGAVRRQQLLTMNELHAAITSETANRKDWNSVYETVQTQVRPDLGDSIKEAFSSVAGLLKELEMEDTQANQRAVRILGYNSMEVTKENIEQVKYFDARVNQVIENMKPSTVLECIRRGVNPLEIPLDELNGQLEEINKEKAVSEEERYSRFLWQMEKNGQISEEERSGYIGVYRLLHQIEKTDGAVIGAVLEAGQELTLGNLLTQARTRKGKGIDARIDENTGFSNGPQMKGSITEQIAKGFSVDSQQQAYYEHLTQKALQEVTPQKLQDVIGADVEKLLNVSLEKFVEDIRNVSVDDRTEKEYYQMQAQKMRDSLQNSQEAEEFLSKLNLQDTAQNIMAVQNVLEDSYSVYKEAHKRRNVLDEQKREQLDEIGEELAESIDEPERLEQKCYEAEKIMEEILTKSYRQSDITLEGLDALRQFGQGIRLQSLMRQHRSYDIPIRTGDGITSLNLTIIHGAEESGKIQISMEDEAFGNLSMDLRVSDGSVKGLVLCDQRQGFEALQENRQTLEQCVENAGYKVKNISYGMDFKTRNELLNETLSEEQTATGDLYRMAKELVRFVKTVL